jgi:hypothetical protein
MGPGDQSLHSWRRGLLKCVSLQGSCQTINTNGMTESIGRGSYIRKLAPAFMMVGNSLSCSHALQKTAAAQSFQQYIVMRWISLWMEQFMSLSTLLTFLNGFKVIPVVPAPPSHSKERLLQISATTVYVTGDFVAPNTATPAATWLAACQTAQDILKP